LRRHSIHRRAIAPFIVALPVLPLSSRRHGLRRCAAGGGGFKLIALIAREGFITFFLLQ